jgi:hypothetical protein
VLKKCGIKHQTTVPYSPEQNGVAERLNRTLVEKARCMLMESGLSTDLWAEAIATANYLKNRSPTKVLKDKTPYEAWTGNKPDLSHLRVFGCKALINVASCRRQKWDPKAQEFIFVGYCEETKGYRVIHPVTKKLNKARDVVFFENEFLGQHPVSLFFTELTDQQPQPQVTTMQTVSVEAGKCDSSVSESSDSVENTMHEIEASSSDNPDSVETEAVRRSCRNTVPNKLIFNNDFVVNQAMLCRPTDPATLEDALQSPDAEKWKCAMEEEICAHTENKTWTLCDVPENKKAIKCKWVFKAKLKSDGKIERYKARLVVKGCSQKSGIDYEETYSPVVRYTSIRLLVALAAKYNLDIDQMDVTTAFLHPELKVEVYMELPEGHRLNGETCRLNKSIYGLKQASRAWNKKLDKQLKEFGFSQSSFDPCVYFKITNGKILIIAVYVDDLLLLSNDSKEKRKLKLNLMKGLGEAHYCLGIRIQRDRKNGVITLDQQKYIEQVLARFNMSGCNGVCTPMDPNQDLFNDELLPATQKEQEEANSYPYQEAIGSIMYAAQGTRPDITFAVGALSRFNNSHGKAHWNAVKRILRYLRHTVNRKLTYRKDSADELCGFSDSDWGGDKSDYKSTTGYVFLLSGAAVSWIAKKQPTVAKSTTEAEYMALSMAASEAIWIKGLYRELVVNAPATIRIYCDNKGAIDLARNPGYRPKTKHIAV